MALIPASSQPLRDVTTPIAVHPTLPRHPLLRPLRSSRVYDESGNGDDDMATSTALDSYRTSLYQLLDSERWAHHRTMQALKAEIGHREQLERQISYVKAECQRLANGLACSAQNLMHCDSECIEMIRQVSVLRDEVASWQAAYSQAILEVRHTIFTMDCANNFSMPTNHNPCVST